MTEPDGGEAVPGGDAGTTDDPVEEFREAAGAVVESLKQLAQAAEKVIEDPETFARVAASGKAVVDAFLGGFAAPPNEADEWPDDGSDSGSVPG